MHTLNKPVTKMWRGRKWYSAGASKSSVSLASFRGEGRKVDYSILNKVFLPANAEEMNNVENAGKMALHTSKSAGNGKRGRKCTISITFPKGEWSMKQVADMNKTSPANVNNHVKKLKDKGEILVTVKKITLPGGRRATTIYKWK